LQQMDSGNTHSSLKPDVCELHESINMKCKQWPGLTCERQSPGYIGGTEKGMQFALP
ncbi:hypothetical protein T4B_3956, partial [Trichinella pseudospiralis]